MPTFEPCKVDETRARRQPAWHGTILPKTDADVWLAAAFADYERIVALAEVAAGDGRPTKARRRGQGKLAVARFEPRLRYLTAVRRLGRDVPLAETKADPKCGDWYDLASGKGILLLAELRRPNGRRQIRGDDGRLRPSANAGKEVTTTQFREHAEKACGKPLASLFDPYVTGKGRSDSPAPGGWAIFSFEKEPEKARIVYGTLKDSSAQREAAGHLAPRSPGAGPTTTCR